MEDEIQDETVPWTRLISHIPVASAFELLLRAEIQETFIPILISDQSRHDGRGWAGRVQIWRFVGAKSPSNDSVSTLSFQSVQLNDRLSEADMWTDITMCVITRAQTKQGRYWANIAPETVKPASAHNGRWMGAIKAFCKGKTDRLCHLKLDHIRITRFNYSCYPE